MSDIAEQAGVSIATVSRVINDTGRVSEVTRHRVLVAIDSLGYERPFPEQATDSPLIGIIVPELINPVFASYAHALQSELSAIGAVPFLCTQTPGGVTEDDYISRLLDSHADGLIFTSGRHADYHADLSRYSKLLEQRIPFVTINGSREEVSAPDFSTDDASGIRCAVRHLASLGHERIALLTGRRHIIPSLRKIEAFVSETGLLGVGPPRVLETFYTYEAGAAGAKELIADSMTAIICASDLQALGVIRTAQSLGLSIPDDLSVVGFDDTSLMAHTDPPLTSIRQPVQAISRAAVRMLEMKIEFGSNERGSFEFTPDLIVRSSTGPVRESARSAPASHGAGQ
ncbi:LacI family DNA-binding transcriptional regulator [Actinomyces culturomici]|uniref:LacI family DNA-binding transcriptional regulator n=1 Tax=Actinomyces culturomici TaxID=1926276 RepID=UPI000E201DFB|nr:LacI family DNA-binding transcriptional regulator [Actinomyces culturomici]